MPFGATVSVENGRLAVPGADSHGLRVYRGIPFAAPPVGPLRWRPPQAPLPWAGVRPVDAFGANAMQAKVYGDLDPFTEGVSEDCLFLNVWTPAASAAERRPVLFWIHGGGFVAGHGAEPRYDGARLAARGIVVVTSNHRLGAFGFLAHPQMTAESPHRASGNYGLLDQVAALAWVKRNIAAFGGDPDCITVAGESAGSISVSALMASPLAAGLFQRAVGESGALFSASPNRPDRSLAAAERYGVSFAEALGARSLAEMRALPADRIVAATPTDHTLWPIVDGHVLPQSPAEIFAAGKQNDVTLLAGWNRDEGFSFDFTAGTGRTFAEIVRERFAPRAEGVLALYPADDPQSARDFGGDLVIVQPTWAWIEAQVKTGTRPVYRYRFDRAPTVPADWFGDTSNADAGAFHAAEIVYVFDTFAAFPWTYSEADRKTSAAMSAYWVNFVKSGNPNGEGLPEWPAYGAEGRRIMVLDAEPHAGVADRDERLARLLRR